MQGHLPGAVLSAHRAQERNLAHERGDGRPVTVIQNRRLAVISGAIAEEQAQGLGGKILRDSGGINMPALFQRFRWADAGAEHGQGPVAVAELVA